MSDDVWRRDEIQSPCVKICLIHPESKLCIGCHRTTDEIADWGRFSPVLRAAIMAELPSRQPGPNKRRGGRSGRLGE
jgi:uncharacterized protein